MRIVEQSCIGKCGQDKCEDAFVVTDDFVCVIDGSTSKSKLPPLPDGSRGGKMAAALVTEVVKGMPADITVENFVASANKRFQERYREYYGEDILERMLEHKEDRWTCSVILYSRHENAIWMIGDCQALLQNPDVTQMELSNDKPYEEAVARERAAYLRDLLNKGKITVDEAREHDPGRELVIPRILQEMRNQNVTYSVMDGFDIAWNAVRVFRDVQCPEIVLASDGYPKLFPTLKETEDYLQECLNADPLMIYRHEATKGWMKGNASFDDRTYIRFQCDV